VIVKGFDDADDRSVRIVNGDGGGEELQPVPVFVVNEACTFNASGIANRGIDGAVGGTGLAFDFVAMGKDAREAIAANDFVAKIAGDALGAVAPEDDTPLCMSTTQRPVGRLSRMLRQISQS
jgi:hypothetical protein